MSAHYIKIEEVTGEAKSKVHQTLKFPTANFVWRIKFNLPLRASTVNNNTCYVTNMDGHPLKTHISYNSTNQYIQIEPLEGYLKGVSYILHITTNVLPVKGKRLQSNVSIQFKI